ncbi:MAG TPA: SgcJ/EcaC family oxidoreductase [Pyrinomonadaceae bacterium]
MSKYSIEEIVERMDEAFNRGDVDAVLDFYEDEAVVVLEPGRVVQGRDKLREAFQFVFGLQPVVRQIKTNVIEANDLALFTSRWTFTGKLADGTLFTREAVATTIFRKQSDGQWRCAIDNPYGPAVLD